MPRHARCARATAPDDSWNWAKRFRIWDATRRIFVYPENWIVPEPRVSKPVEVRLSGVVSFRPPDGSGAGRGRAASAGPRGARVLFSGAAAPAALGAAYVVARDMARDLYRIDMRAVVSTSMAETEKQLDRVLAAAARRDAVLLFDEADALFARRSEVKDAHDRYANSELLQRTAARAAPVVLATRKPAPKRAAQSGSFHFVIRFRAPRMARARR